MFGSIGFSWVLWDSMRLYPLAKLTRYSMTISATLMRTPLVITYSVCVFTLVLFLLHYLSAMIAVLSGVVVVMR